MAAGLLAGCGGSKTASWTVTCPWASSGVAAMVSQKAASMSTNHSESIILVADAIKGDAATVNTWVADTKANDTELVFVENLYSSVFVLSADASLNISGMSDLEVYAAGAGEISVAANGATGSEAFLAAALFGSMGYGDKLKITPYRSAAEAAQAVARGETSFAVSHQSQILETYQQGGVTIVCAFDGEFAGVEGVGKYGYPYFRNRCFVLARSGTKAETVSELKKLYDDILADSEMSSWLRDTMMLEVDTMSEQDVQDHIQNVQNIVNEYYDIVVG